MKKTMTDKQRNAEKTLREYAIEISNRCGYWSLLKLPEGLEKSARELRDALNMDDGDVLGSALSLAGYLQADGSKRMAKQICRAACDFVGLEIDDVVMVENVVEDLAALS